MVVYSNCSEFTFYLVGVTLFLVQAFKALLTSATSDDQLSSLGELLYQVLGCFGLYRVGYNAHIINVSYLESL